MAHLKQKEERDRVRRIGIFLGPFACFGGIALLSFSLFTSFTAGFELFPLIFMATIPEWMLGHSIPIEAIIALYFAQTSAGSQQSTLLILAAIILIIVGITLFAVGFKAATKAEEVQWAPEPATREYRREAKPTVKEVIKEKEVIVYVRCSHCGAKVLETETKCPNCGAKL